MTHKALFIGGSDVHRPLLKAALEEAGVRVSMANTRKYTNHWLGKRLKAFDLIIHDTEDAERDARFWRDLRESARGAAVLILTSAFDTTDYNTYAFERTLRRPFTIGDVVSAAQALLAAREGTRAET